MNYDELGRRALTALLTGTVGITQVHTSTDEETITRYQIPYRDGYNYTTQILFRSSGPITDQKSDSRLLLIEFSKHALGEAGELLGDDEAALADRMIEFWARRLKALEGKP